MRILINYGRRRVSFASALRSICVLFSDSQMEAELETQPIAGKKDEKLYQAMDGDLTDNGDYGESSDDTNLVMSDSELTTGRTKKKKYLVVPSAGSAVSKGPGCVTCSRNEWICIIVGGVIIVALVILFVGIGAGLGFGGNGTSTSSSTGNEPWKNVRLPSSITPKDYIVTLTADLEKFTVTGSSVINLNVVEKTSYIIIHAKSMNISGFSVIQNNKNIAVSKNFTYEKNNFYILILKTSLLIGKAILIMNYDYTLGDDLVGFYRSSYSDASGTTHWIATTQFEPTDARKAFPCFDEPALKANFTISITHSSELNAHSNMPVVSSSRDGAMVTTAFETSVKMSTYLVAFVVSDFECMTQQTETEYGVNVSVCSRPEVLHSTRYALEKASDILKFYENYFDVPYPLPKQDLFAIPDFAAGAMENWGLITYRETELLYDADVDPTSSKQRVAVVIAHELAHQWFGNLVTMEWWDGLWLNEGFATFTEYIGTNATEPSFHMLDQFLVDDVFVAFVADGVNESHPIIQTVSNPDEINELFDSISYSKGGSVLRMLRDLLTAEKFQAGITYYLEKSKYDNAKTQQLWDALQTVVEDHSLNVSEIMDTWTLQMGYPVLHVNTVTGWVTQQRFFDLQPNGTIAPSPYNYIWLVPFNYLTEEEYSDQFVSATSRIIKTRTERVEFPSDLGFIKVNVEQTGFYRVNYDLQNWYDIITHLQLNPQSEVLSPSDRAGLLDDAFSLSSAGLLDTRVALNLSQYLSQETDYVPCYTGLAHLTAIGARLSLTPVYGVYQAFVRNLTSVLAQEFNFDSTGLNHLQIFLRTAVLNAAWSHGNTDVISDAILLFEGWMSHNETVPADVKLVVYSVGIAYGEETEWDFVWQQYLSTSDPYEKRLYLRALAMSCSPWLLSRYLEYAIDTSKIRSHDASSVIGYVSANVYGRFLTWNFVRNNWDYLLKHYGGGSFSFSRLIKTVTKQFTTELELSEVEHFFADQSDLASGARAVRQSIEIIKRNIQWLKINRGLIQECLEDTQLCFSSS